MAAVENNSVVIIRGATGCGKTTQVPQYILERFIKGGRASDCNIVVTQVTVRERLPHICIRWPQHGRLLTAVVLSSAQTDQRRVRGRACGL